MANRQSTPGVQMLGRQTMMNAQPLAANARSNYQAPDFSGVLKTIGDSFEAWGKEREKVAFENINVLAKGKQEAFLNSLKSASSVEEIDEKTKMFQDDFKSYISEQNQGDAWLNRYGDQYLNATTQIDVPRVKLGLMKSLNTIELDKTAQNALNTVYASDNPELQKNLGAQTQLLINSSPFLTSEEKQINSQKFNERFTKAQFGGLLDRHPSEALAYAKAYEGDMDVKQKMQTAAENKVVNSVIENERRAVISLYNTDQEMMNQAMTGALSYSQALSVTENNEEWTPKEKKTFMKIAGYPDALSGKSVNSETGQVWTKEELGLFNEELRKEVLGLSLKRKNGKVGSSASLGSLYQTYKKSQDFLADGKITPAQYNSFVNMYVQPMMDKAKDSISSGWSDTSVEATSAIDSYDLLGEYLGEVLDRDVRDEGGYKARIATEIMDSSDLSNEEKGAILKKLKKADFYESEARREMGLLKEERLYENLKTRELSFADLDDLSEGERVAILSKSAEEAQNLFYQKNYPKMMRMSGVPDEVISHRKAPVQSQAQPQKRMNGAEVKENYILMQDKNGNRAFVLVGQDGRPVLKNGQPILRGQK